MLWIITLFSVPAAYLAIWQKGGWAMLYGVVLILSWAAYAVLLRPFFFSPLRHLPEPTKGNSFLYGHQAVISSQPTGWPQLGCTPPAPGTYEAGAAR